jgi:hypothetical protein
MSSVNVAALVIVLGLASLQAQEPAWTGDVTAASYVEAWDLNEGREWLNGVQAGLDRGVWRGLAVRVEGVLLHVHQAGEDPWLKGVTLGMRVRRHHRLASLFLDIAGGRASASESVPPRGTRSNYVLLLGGGVEIPWSAGHITVATRWFHISNNGSEGRDQNPDVQSLGLSGGFGFKF